MADYLAVAKIFEELHHGFRSAPNEIEWQSLSRAIETSSTSIQSKFVNTLAAFGVEVSFPLSFC